MQALWTRLNRFLSLSRPCLPMVSVQRLVRVSGRLADTSSLHDRDFQSGAALSVSKFRTGALLRTAKYQGLFEDWNSSVCIERVRRLSDLQPCYVAINGCCCGKKRVPGRSEASVRWIMSVYCTRAWLVDESCICIANITDVTSGVDDLELWTSSVHQQIRLCCTTSYWTALYMPVIFNQMPLCLWANPRQERH